VAADRPLAILIDDLHWADSASLDLVHYVARGLADQRVLLLGAYRLDEARAQPRLRSLVRSLQRLGLAEELTPTSLPADAVTKLAPQCLQARRRRRCCVSSKTGRLERRSTSPP